MSLRIRTTIIFIFSWLVFSLNIGGNSIYILDEAKNATCALEMMESSNWIVPTFNGVLRTDKPPLHYFLMIIAYKIFGTNEFAARFFSAFFGALTVVITFLFSVKFWGQSVGNWVAVVLLSSLHFALQFHLAVPDPYLIFFITAGLISFFYFLNESRTIYLVAFYASLGLGVLTKGPIAVLLPGFALFLFVICTKRLNWNFIKSLRLPVGTAIFLAVALPWYWLVHNQTDGAWTQGFFLQHNVGRFTETMEGHGGIFILTPLFVLVGLLPFSVFIFQTVKLVWHDRQNEVVLYCASIVTAVIVFFSVSSTKLPNYVVPAYPFLAVLLANFLSKSAAGTLTTSRLPLWIYLILASGIPVGVYLGLKSEPYLSHLSWLSAFFLLLPLGALLGLWLGRRRVANAYYALFISFLILNSLFFAFIFPKVDRETPVFESKAFLAGQDIRVAYYKRFNPSFAFYLPKPIQALNSPKELTAYLQAHEAVYIISRARYLDEIEEVADVDLLVKKRDFFERSTTILLKERE
ncbi:glycosyltransferase family 39 protein [Fulvivirgaceae bacterium BMA12]|uniref:Glycosyltransferase family 39 protein n=1 Tax=Agaribacillus aureus TaxID=3051825 RepID=A0ABT8L2B0_9BACT|nr:glycosyltransferase family 39 protein [Fulvivirgaceae bacterium BMA12]